MSEYAQVTNNDGLITDVNREQGYATLTLNRPDRLNSLGSELLKSLVDSLKSVASDDSIRALKGDNRPINSQSDRSYVLAALEVVDYLVIFDQDTPFDLIKPSVNSFAAAK